MKRKVIQIAESTQLVSLPRAWAKANNIKKGDEVEVTVTERGILVSKIAQPPKMRRIEVSVPKEVSTRLIVIALYKGGFDEIQLQLANPEEVHNAQRFVSANCVGFEVVEQGRTYIVIRKISDTIHNEFDTIMKRLMIFVGSMAREAYEAALNNDADIYKSVIAMDENVNKFAYFCMRVLNKHPETRKEPIGPMYHIIDQLEGIGDAYKEISIRLLNVKQKQSREITLALKALCDYLHETLRAFAERRTNNLARLPTMNTATRRMVEKFIGRSIEESLLRSLMLEIAQLIRNIVSPIVLLSYLNRGGDSNGNI